MIFTVISYYVGGCYFMFIFVLLFYCRIQLGCECRVHISTLRILI